MASHDRDRAHDALRLNTQLLAAELVGRGIDVDCVPLLDLQFPGAHDVIGDRAFCSDPELVAGLGRIVCQTMLAAGVMPIVKHIPGHGRDRVDSHKELPVVDTRSEEHTSELQSLMRTPYAVFCLKTKKISHTL